jgi:Zinc knuckle
MDLSGTQESRPKRGKQPWKPRGQGPRRGNSNNGYSNNGYREQRPNQGSLRSGKTFKRTPQQQKRFEDGAYMNCGKKGHFARDCKQGQSTNAAKGTSQPSYDSDETLRGTRECAIKHFAFCYNNAYPVHEEAKYGASYWPQEPSPGKFAGTAEEEEQDRLFELEQDLYATCGRESARRILELRHQMDEEPMTTLGN